MTRLEAPFESHHAIFAATVPAGLQTSTPLQPTTVHELVLPSCYHSSNRCLIQIRNDPTYHTDDFISYITHDLNVKRLNDIHKHLWLAGLPILPRPLHAQLMIGRSITITEKADLHLLWRGRELYLKPLPEYLLSHSTWTDILTHPANTDLYASATGLLYSYISLITSQSDLSIAHSTNLLSKSITYSQWTTLTSQVLTSLHSHPQTPNSTPSILNKRYIYGELRLARVNFIFRMTHPGNIVKAYHHRYTDYKTFFGRNFAWVVTGVVYVTVVLTAMQVGLATRELQDDVGFNRASYGFTVFAIVGPLAVVAFMMVFGGVLVLYHLRYALGKRREAVGLEIEDGVGVGVSGTGTGAAGNDTSAATAAGIAVKMQNVNGSK